MKSILNKGIILIAGLLISQVLTGQFSHQLQGNKLPWTKTPQVKDIQLPVCNYQRSYWRRKGGCV